MGRIADELDCCLLAEPKGPRSRDRTVGSVEDLEYMLCDAVGYPCRLFWAIRDAGHILLGLP